jgi:DNA-binding NtrC family response regulator
MRSRILCISGCPEDARTLSQMLHSLPVTLERAETVQQARTRLFQRRYDAVVTESNLPDGDWRDVLHVLRESPYETQLVVTDPHADARLWSEALNMGAYDLVAQPFYEPEVRRILCNACSREIPSMAVG